MTNDYDKLRAMDACAPALQWIGNRTIEQAWRECERSEWMCWLLERIAPGDPRLRLAAADMAERVWDLIPDEPTRLAAAWAIGAARRGDADEMRAAAYAASTASAAAAYAATSAYAHAAAAYAAGAYAAAAAAYAATAYAYATCAAEAADAAARSFASRADESAAQADILRGYFSAREIGRLFRQAPA